MASVKRNFGYNLILTFCNYLFPLLTYPYVSRILGVDGIGVCNFVDGIINYFVLFSTLGIGSYGVREIAKCKHNKVRRSTVFSNLIAINAIGTIISVIALVGSTLWIPSLKEYRGFLWIGVLKLCFNMFLIEWFFQGIQNFKFITIRSIIVRFLYVCSIFVFIHQKEDVYLYYGLTVSIIIINAIVNWNYSKKFRKISFKNLQLKKFVIPVLTFGYYRILTSMYTSFNLVFLGFNSGEREVGYFYTATKLYSILMGVFSAFTTVMVPKVSEMLANQEKRKLQIVADKTFSLLTVLSLPLILFCFFCTSDIISILSGPGYEGAYTPFRIVIFLLLIIGTEQIAIQQFLMASNSNKNIFRVSTSGAIVGFVANLLLVPFWGAVGSAISWGLSEFAVLLVGLYSLNKTMGISFQYHVFISNVLWALFYIIPLLLIHLCGLNRLTNLFLSGGTVFLTFLLINTKLNKNELVLQLISIWKYKVFKKNDRSL